MEISVVFCITILTLMVSRKVRECIRSMSRGCYKWLPISTVNPNKHTEMTILHPNSRTSVWNGMMPESK